jgi:synaptic vesicle membrane protein VAT-1
VNSREAWWLPRAGSLARLERRADRIPDPGPGEARVRVRAVGLNFADIFAAHGLYSATPSGAFIPGLECAGVVEALGPGDGGAFRTGDPVMVLTRFGACASVLNIPIKYLHPLAPGTDYIAGAAFPVQALTAWYGLVELGALAAGETVLLHSAAGGVGLMSLAILETVGAQAVAVVGGEDKRAFLVRSYGLQEASIIVRTRRGFARALDGALAALDRRGFDIVFDATAGEYLKPGLERLAPEGRYVLFGAASFMTHGARPDYLTLAWRYLRRPRIDPLSMIDRNRGLLAFNLIWLFQEAVRLPAAYAAAQRLVRRPPHVHAVLPFEQAPEAFALLQSGRTIGKVVLELRS